MGPARDRGVVPRPLPSRIAAFFDHATTIGRPLLTTPLAGDAARELLRAAMSSLAYLGAARRAASAAERRAKLALTVEALDEAVFWLEYLQRTRLSEDSGLRDLIASGRVLLTEIAGELE
jgi:hypothetical protein